MSHPYHGACLCGSVRFAFSGRPRFVADCVCESCRRAHGASAVAWVGVDASQFELLTGEASVRWYASSAPSERGFCQACGTRLFFRSIRWPGEIHMALACMTAPHDLMSTKVSFAHELPRWTALSLPRESVE